MKNIFRIFIAIILIYISNYYFFRIFNKQDSTKQNPIIDIVTSQSSTTLNFIEKTEINTTFTTSNSNFNKTTSTQQSNSNTSTTPVSNAEKVDEPVYININTASISELVALDGIGEATAQEIVNYREQNGFFNNRNELLNVKGIGEVKLNNIWNNIYIENETFYEETQPETQENYDNYTETQPVITQTTEITTQISETTTQATDIELTETTTEVLLVNINTADKEELMKLPYVTEEIAIEILDLRKTIQYFSHNYELLLIDSLTQKQVEEIIEFVTVSD